MIIRKFNIYSLQIICVSLICINISGCFSGLFSNKTYAWKNSQYSYQSNSHWNALDRARKHCGDFAFKEGIRIDCVTYYDRESARAAKQAYRQARLHIYPRPEAPHEGQYNYFNDRYRGGLNQKGWYLYEVPKKK